MGKPLHFEKYDIRGAYHWTECDRRMANWKSYNPALAARYEITAAAVAGLRLRGKMLDVGCGDGLLMAKVASTMDEVKGVDSERSAISWARQKLLEYPNCEPIHTTCYELPFQSAFFDLVTSADVIEHLNDPEGHLREIGRVLKPHGALVLTTPKWRADRYWDERHQKEYRVDELKTLLLGYFGNVELSFFWPLVYSRLYSTYIGWRLLKILALLGWNVFHECGKDENRFGQILAICRCATTPDARLRGC